MNRMRELRTEKSMTMKSVSEALNIPYTTYVNYEKGDREPNSEMLIAIANFFGVTIDYLIGRSNSRDDARINFQPPEITDDVVVFPVVGDIAAGYDEIAVENWTGDTVSIPTEYLKGRERSEFFVLRVVGDSMYPLYIAGDRVLILKQPTLNRSGDVGAVLYEDECATLKKIEYVTGEDWMKLIPLNPAYPPKTITGEQLEHCRVIGIPRMLIRDIDE